MTDPVPDEGVDKRLRVLLLTHNVCGIYDDPVAAQRQWIQDVKCLAEDQQADFIAIHMQEVGGSNWRKDGLAHSVPLSDRLHTAFPDFWSTNIICNQNVNDEFTALGSIYMVTLSSSVLTFV